MSTVLLSYATPNFWVSQQQLERSARRFGVRRCLSANNLWLRLFHPDFCRRQFALLNAKLGAGYWVWKPYLILEALKNLEKGETLIYLDSGIEIVAPLNPLLDCCRQNNGVAVFSTGVSCAQWTKRDVFVMLDCDVPQSWSAPMLAGGMLVLQKTPEALLLLQEWARVCLETDLVSDAPNRCGLPNPEDFRAHRHDQSILSVVSCRQGIRPHRSPCQYGDYLKTPELRRPEDYLGSPPGSRPYTTPPTNFCHSPYGTLLDVHRSRNATPFWLLPFYYSRLLYRALSLRQDGR